MRYGSSTIMVGAMVVAAAAMVLRPQAEAVALHTLPAASAAPGARSGEVMRLRAHFDEVERELLVRDVSDLTPEQRAARARHIQVLREYSARGIFPHNHDFPGERVPYFVDHQGTHCAMAYLIARSGDADLVEKVRATQNHAFIAELAADPVVVAWLDAAGLTVEEAARIQPAYGWFPPEEREPQVSAPYAVGSALVSGFSGAAIALNLTTARGEAPRRWPGVLGVTAGALGIGVGATKLGDGGAPAVLGAVNAAIGLASLGLGVRTLLFVPADRPAPDPATARRGASVSAVPVIAPLRDGGAGVMLSIRF